MTFVRQPVLWLLLATACVSVPDARLPFPADGTVADRARFGAEVGPLLEKHCGDGSCHGRPERPLSLYSAGSRRLDPAMTHMKVPLSNAEVDANYLACLGFIDSSQPRDTTLLKKAVGQLGHKGGPVFEALSDPMAKAVAEWIAGTGAP